jgi:hypothetical protein
VWAISARVFSAVFPQRVQLQEQPQTLKTEAELLLQALFMRLFFFLFLFLFFFLFFFLFLSTPR